MRKNLTPEGVFAEYEKGESYNRAIELYGTTQKNEDFYVVDQWKGVNAPDIEKPVINFLKRAVCYLISMIVSDDVSVALTPGARSDDADFLADCLEGEVATVIEQTKAKTLARDMLRNCAVDGDGCFYFWFEPTGGAGGRIRIENLDNTKVIFGNPYVKEAEDQPYIIIVRRRSAAELREEAKTAGAADWENIRPDGAGLYMNEGENAGNDLTTELIRLWKEDCVLIMLDMIRAYYGVREVNFDAGGENASVFVDFSAVDTEGMKLSVDVGASSYWSELMQIETADSLYRNGVITDAVTYLESIPDKYIRGKKKIIAKLEEQKAKIPEEITA